MEKLVIFVIAFLMAEIIHRYKTFRLLEQLDERCEKELDEACKGGIMYAIDQIIGML